MDEWDAVKTLVDLLRQPTVIGREIRTAGDLADMIDTAVHARRWRPEPPKAWNT